jgi:hypothetical protein
VCSLPKLLRPVDGIDVNPERVLTQAISISRGLDHDSKDGGPTLGGGKLAVVVAALDPGDPKALRRSADHTGYFHCDLQLAEFGNGIADAGVVVEGRGAAIGRKVIGTQPVLAEDNGVSSQPAHVFDEARQMEGNLRIGRLVEGIGWADRPVPGRDDRPQRPMA